MDTGRYIVILAVAENELGRINKIKPPANRGLNHRRFCIMKSSALCSVAIIAQRSLS